MAHYDSRRRRTLDVGACLLSGDAAGYGAQRMSNINLSTRYDDRDIDIDLILNVFTSIKRYSVQ